MTISLATKGVICQQTQIVRTNLISAELFPFSQNPSNDCLCGISYKQSNSIDIQFAALNNGVKIPSDELTAADDIVFALKLSKYQTDEESAILKKKSLGEITVLSYDPSTVVPNLLIPLSSDDMSIVAGAYYMALCIDFTATNKNEADLFNQECSFNSVDVIKDILAC